MAIKAGVAQAALKAPAVRSNKIPIAGSDDRFAPLFQQIHVRRAHVFCRHYALVFSRNILCPNDNFRPPGWISREYAAPRGKGNQSQEDGGACEYLYLVIHWRFLMQFLVNLLFEVFPRP